MDKYELIKTEFKIIFDNSSINIIAEKKEHQVMMFQSKNSRGKYHLMINDKQCCFDKVKIPRVDVRLYDKTDKSINICKTCIHYLELRIEELTK